MKNQEQVPKFARDGVIVRQVTTEPRSGVVINVAPPRDDVRIGETVRDLEGFEPLNEPADKIVAKLKAKAPAES